MMDEKDEWIKEYDSIIVNGYKIWFRCILSFAKKTQNEDRPSIQLMFDIYKDGVGWIDWNNFRYSYLAEKLTDYIKHSINGQRSIYWDNNEVRKFD